MSARSWIGWGLATLVIAVLAHMVSLHYAPRFIMHVAMRRMGAVNAIHHQPRVTAGSRGVVRPSPDLLYSACPFDLKDGPLLVTAPVPQNTYWSVSVFDTNANNIFALNDRQIHEPALELAIIGPTGPRKIAFANFAATERSPIPRLVSSPTIRGLVLFRTLISNEKDFVRVDAIRRQANCKPIGKS